MGIEELIPNRKMVGAAGEYRSINDQPGLEAIIASNPEDETDPVYVTIPSFDNAERLWGPCNWSPVIVSQIEYALPAIGDSAFVVISSEEEVWIVNWWPHD